MEPSDGCLVHRRGARGVVGLVNALSEFFPRYPAHPVTSDEWRLSVFPRHKAIKVKKLGNFFKVSIHFHPGVNLIKLLHV